MITLFTIPKAFDGLFDTIQRNAIASWTQVHPDSEVVVFGDDPGVAEACKDLGVRHVPDVARSDEGTPLLDGVFARAQEMASTEWMCYVNADIVFLDDLAPSVERVSSNLETPLLVGRRWDLDVTERLTMEDGWQDRLRDRARSDGELHPPTGIDYFVFEPGTVREMPPFAVGRPGWDNWMIYDAKERGVPVVDMTAAVTIIHQNHDYLHHPEGEEGVWHGKEKERHDELIGGPENAYTILDADLKATAEGGLKGNWTPYRFYRYLSEKSRDHPWLKPVVAGVRRIGRALSGSS